MPIARSVDRVLPFALLAALFAVSIASRPLLPVDETRYLSIAWEMFSRRDILVPTLNFQPYFQKPPLLFWLIDLSWAVFGVRRAAALVVIFTAASLVMVLTQRLARTLLPNEEGIAARMPWIVLGSVVFAIYSSLILFDLLLTVFLLGAILALVRFARRGKMRHLVLAGLMVGLGLLSKGPVIFIHLACPIALYPLWRNPISDISPGRFYRGVPILLVVALAIGLAWLAPALYRTGGDFAVKLVWRQAAGRLAGSIEGAHARPFYFYLPLVPVAVLPWAFYPDLWRELHKRKARRGDEDRRQDRIVRFLALWCLIVLFAFSLISGKQPHYLLPLLPAVTILFGCLMSRIPVADLRRGALIVFGLLAIGQIVASRYAFPRLDLAPLAQFVADHRDAEWGFAGSYQGEVTFLARLEKPFVILDRASVADWLKQDPKRFAITEMQGAPSVAHRISVDRNESRFVVLGAAQEQDGSALP